MKNKIHSLIVEGVLFCGSGLGLLSYSLVSYRKSFNKDWAQSPYLFPLIVGAAMTGLSAWLIGEGLTKEKCRRDRTSKRNGSPGSFRKPDWRGVCCTAFMWDLLSGIG